MPRRIQETDKKKNADTLAMVESMIAEAIQGRANSRVLEETRRYDDYYFGNHKIKQRPKKLGRAQYSKFAEIAEGDMAALTENLPRWDFRPQGGTEETVQERIFTAKALSQVLNGPVWDSFEWQVQEEGKGEMSVQQAQASGSSHIKTILDPVTHWPNFEVIPAEAIAPDPAARTKRQLRFIIHFFVSSPKKIKRIYGVDVNAGGQVMLGDAQGDKDAPTYQANASNTAPSEVWANLRHRGSRNVRLGEKFEQVVGAEIWMEDETMQAIPFDVSETNAEHSQMAEPDPSKPDVRATAGQHHPKHIEEHEQLLSTLDPAEDLELMEILRAHIEEHQEFPQVRQRKKYPRGRVVTAASGELLRDEPNPLPIDWRDVFIKWDYMPSRRGYWGKPFGYDLYDPQDDLNHRKNSITQNINMLNNGVRKIKRGVYKSIEKIGNLIGVNIPVDRPDDITVDYGSAMPPQFFGDLGHTESFMDRVSGNNDIAQGRYPSGSPAAASISELLEQSSKRHRQVIKHYAGAMHKMARNAIALATEFMSEDEVFEIIGEDAQTQLIKWGELKNGADLKLIRIDIKPMLATLRQQEFSEAVRLFEVGIYDLPAVLSKLDDPQKYGVLERRNELAMAKQAIDQLASENEALKSEINTFLNRQQTEEGVGNVGI